MPIGPGKYGARAEILLREVGADLVVVITVGGFAGSAFDVASTDPEKVRSLPALLRHMASEIERDIQAGLQ